MQPKEEAKIHADQPENINSEFEYEGYDLPDVVRALEEALPLENGSQADAHFYSVVDRFNEAHRVLMAKGAHSIDRDCPVLDQDLSFEEITELDSTEDGKRIHVDYYTDRLKGTLKNLLSCQKEKKLLYDKKGVSEYLDAFFELSRSCIFTEENYNLYDSSFRNSEFLITLLSFSGEKKAWPEKANKDPGLSKRIRYYYVYRFTDPFALDILDRSLHCVSKLGERASKNKTDGIFLKRLRQELLGCSIQSAFHRYITLDGINYRVDLNRHNSKLIAHPMSLLSSTVETKPIRLFEKTASFIRNNIPNKCEEYALKVCLIGHTEKSANGTEAPLYDYMSAILYWYDQLPEALNDQNGNQISKPRLNLIINNIISRDDEPPTNFERNHSRLVRFRGAHKVTCDINAVDYEKYFAFNTREMEGLIQQNQLLFLLDCPWLSIENYEIGRNSSLDSYCNMLSKKERTDADPLIRFDDDFKDFYENSVMRQLSAQYNRLMSSKSIQAGEVVRSMKDSLINRIQKNIEMLDPAKGGKKELYIFSSESDGIDYSYVNTFPLTRTEQYDGKSFTIIQFKNYASEHLKVDLNEDIEFTFNLWGVLKYICAAYAYRFFKKKTAECLGIIDGKEFSDRIKDPNLFFALYRNIIIHFSISERCHKIVISVGFTEQIDQCLRVIADDLDIDDAKKRLREVTLELIRPLYQNCVFRSNSEYGDDAIKTAFQMNLYSKAKSVNALFFLHQYQLAYRGDMLSQFNVIVTDDEHIVGSSYVEDEFLGNDFFMDKKLYMVLFNQLERTSGMTAGINSMLDKSMEKLACAEERFNSDSRLTGQNIDAMLLDNTVEVCQLYGEDNSYLCMNAMYARKK